MGGGAQSGVVVELEYFICQSTLILGRLLCSFLIDSLYSIQYLVAEPQGFGNNEMMPST